MKFSVDALCLSLCNERGRDNTAAGWGGAVLLDMSHAVNISSSIFRQNRAVSGGASTCLCLVCCCAVCGVDNAGASTATRQAAFTLASP